MTITDKTKMQLRKENLLLKDKIRKIEERLSKLEASVPGEKVIVLRELTPDQAKEEIRKLFSTGKRLYYSDIALELGLDLELVVNICNELQEQGEISVDA